MKKFNLKAMNLDVVEILTREQLKHVMGAEGSGSGSGYPDPGGSGGGDDGSGSGSGGSGSGGRCSNDRLCSMYQPLDGGCKEMATGQCRCVLYRNGSPSESVPDSYCLL